MRYRARLIGMAAALLLSVYASVLRAQAPDGSAEAKEQFQQGREALKQGDCARALTLFRKSYELYPKPGTLMNMATCEDRLGMVASAWQHFRAVASQLPVTDARVAIANKRALELEPRIPWLRINLAAGAPSGTTVRCDGTPVELAQVGVERPLDPGVHVLVVTAPDRRERRYDVALTLGKHVVVSVEPGSKDVSVEAAAPRLAGRQEEPGGNGAARIAGFAVGGVGVAGLIVGGVTGSLALVKKGQLRDMCPVVSRCTPDGVAIESEARAMATVSTVSFVIGLAGVGGGAALLLTSKGNGGSHAAKPVTSLYGGGGVVIAPTLFYSGVGASAQGKF